MKFNVRFQLRNPHSKKASKVYLVWRWTADNEKSSYSGSANKFVYPTQVSVHPKNWDKKQRRVKNTNAEPMRFLMNKLLTSLYEKAEFIYHESINEKIPLTKEYLKKALEGGEKQITLFGFIEKYIAESQNRTNPKTGLKISYRTIQEYNTTLKNLKEFQKENDESLNWRKVSVNTFKDFRNFLTSVKKYSLNNTAKHLENFRQFLREAKDEKFEFDHEILNSKRIPVAREEAVNVALSEEELKRIENLKLIGIKEKVRDLFLVSCWTGLRISDFNNLKSHNIKHMKEGDFIEKYQKKTGGLVVIPCFQIVKDILNKWNDVLPSVSDQKINMHLKEICKEAKINSVVQKRITKGGERLNIAHEKWEMCSSHTGRRSFCTNMIKRGYNIKSVMLISGHQKEKVFLKYL